MRYFHMFPSCGHEEVLVVASHNEVMTAESLDSLIRAGLMRAVSQQTAASMRRSVINNPFGGVDIIQHR